MLPHGGQVVEGIFEIGRLEGLVSEVGPDKRLDGQDYRGGLFRGIFRAQVFRFMLDPEFDQGVVFLRFVLVGEVFCFDAASVRIPPVHPPRHVSSVEVFDGHDCMVIASEWGLSIPQRFPPRTAR